MMCKRYERARHPSHRTGDHRTKTSYAPIYEANDPSAEWGNDG